MEVKVKVRVWVASFVAVDIEVDIKKENVLVIALTFARSISWFDCTILK